MLRYAVIRAVGTKAIGGLASGAVLWTVNVNTGAAGAILKIYEGGSASGILVATIDASTKSGQSFGVYMKDGIFLDLSVGNADCTIGYA